MRIAKRLLIVGVSIVALSSLGAEAAQPPRGGRPGPGPQGPPAAGGPGGFPFERVLQLTEQQREAVQGLREKEREAMKPLMEQMGPLHKNLREALDSGAANAGEVGQIVIETHSLQTQADELRKSFHDQVVSLLTDEQKQKLETLESLMGPGGRGPRGPGGMGGPGGHGPGRPPQAGPRPPRN